MAQIIWTEPALNDLDEIASFIALDKETAAKKLVSRVFETVDNLTMFPELGRTPPELDSETRYRELVIGPCRIFYRIENKVIYILFVMRSERLLSRYIINERLDDNQVNDGL